MVPWGDVGETVIHITKTEVGLDEFREPVYSEAEITYHNVIVAGGYGRSGSTATTEGNMDTMNLVEYEATLHFSPEAGVDVKSEDAFIVRGKRFEVVGGGFLWVDPFTKTPFGYAVNVRRVEG